MAYAKVIFIFAFLFSSSLAQACKGNVGGKEGNCAPDFELSTLSGKLIQLSNLKGSVVLLNFWATWCEPCRVEIPLLERLYHRLPKSVQLFAINEDVEGKPVIEKFYGELLKKSISPFPILLDSNQAVTKRFGTFQYPETYIIDKTGKIRDKVEGMIPDWDSSIMVHYLEQLSTE